MHTSHYQRPWQGAWYKNHPYAHQPVQTSPVSGAANVQYFDDAVEITVVAPGFQKDQFKLELNGRELLIRSEIPADQNTPKYSRQEFAVTNIRRSFRLSDHINTDDIQAKYDNGLLVIRLGKVAATPKSEIPVA